MRLAVVATMSITVQFIILVGVVCSAAADYCYVDDADPYHYYGSETHYGFINNMNATRLRFPAGCKAVQIWHFNRHGTRYPSKSTIEDMQDLYDLRDRIVANHVSGLGRMCDGDVALLSKWNLTYSEDQSNKLAKQGFRELYNTARRYHVRLPQLMAQQFDPNDYYQFRHTTKERTTKSAEAFARGLFPHADVYIPPAIKYDPILDYFDNCSKWDAAVDANPDADQYKTFLTTDTVIQAAEIINQRLGFDADDYIDVDLIKTAWEACRYDVALRPNKQSAWCSLFAEDQLKIFEYYADLKHYYQESYGTDYDRLMGYPLLADLLERLTRIQIKGNTEPLGLFYFSHSTLVNLLITTLGIAEDETPLRYDNYDEQSRRQYRTSFLDSFATTFSAVVLDCKVGGFKVQFYHQERPAVEMCDRGLCSVRELEKKYAANAKYYTVPVLCY